MTVRLLLLFLVLLFLQSCQKDTCNWTGGEITSLGTYCNREGFKVRVYEQEGYLQYELLDSFNNLVLKEDRNISLYHKWGIFLDSDKSLWVFSSDIGDAVWLKDTLTDEYVRKRFSGWLTKDSVPQEVYASSMKRFIHLIEK